MCLNLQGQELAAVANLLQCGQSLRQEINSVVQERKDRQGLLQPILEMVSTIVFHQEIVKIIWNAVDDDGHIKDTASTELRQARTQEQAIEAKLREILKRLTQEQSGSNDDQEIVNVDGRLCIIVAADSSTSVAGLLLQRGPGGATAYFEPTSAVPINNKLAQARAEVSKAEYNILSNITRKILQHVDDIQLLLETIVGLDVMLARAKFSSWARSTRPTFINHRNIASPSTVGVLNFDKLEHSEVYQPQGQGILMNLQRCRHPLLVHQHQQVLREAKLKCKAKQKALSRLRGRANTSATMILDMETAVGNAESEVTLVEGRSPVAIDLQISCRTRVVAITGPNTGGKTATMKTVGLAALMAKAGLFVLAAEPAYLPWFDAVFADIGDEQSLSQCLSTFSGHILRIKNIKSESSGGSLVLLDEVGAGTDPTEGAALGMALLESFAADGYGGSLLTLATTHHGEMKTLKYSDDRFENASVEFDEKKLAPTYKLLWGIPGRSNALNIAGRLGVPKAVLTNARSLYGAASAELNEVISELENARHDFEVHMAEAETLHLESQKLFEELVEAAKRLAENSKLLHINKCEHLNAEATAIRSRLNVLTRRPTVKVFNSLNGLSSTERNSRLDKEIVVKEKKQARVGSSSELQIPRIGSSVYVAKLGRQVKVVDVNLSRREITVASGSMQLKLNLTDISEL